MPDKGTQFTVPARKNGQATSAAERSLRARLAATTLHAQRDGREATASARAAFLKRFEREVDPDGSLDMAERQRRAAQARRAYFARLALASIKARRGRRGGDAA